MSIADLKSNEFQAHALQPSMQGPVLLKFYGPNCGPCHSLAPLLHQLDGEHPGLKIVAMDASQNQDVAQQFGVRMVPTLIMLRQGQAVARHDGSPGTKPALDQFVAPHLA